MKIWDSVAMDVFSMPETTHKGIFYDSMIICVDRHTGWILAIPTQKRGLTAEKMVDIMLQKWTDIGGGIPSVITSDRGPQFVGDWFKCMCTSLGIRQAYSQAYRAQANGRAERAGRQIIEWLEKLGREMEINWVQVSEAVKAGIPPDGLHNFTGSFVINLVNDAAETQGKINEPMEISNGGTGFMLIKREVFETLADKVPEYNNDMFVAVDNVRKPKIIKEFFATSIDKTSGNRLLSEDYHFCKIAREAGFRVWAAPWVNLNHCGTYNFEGRLTRV